MQVLRIIPLGTEVELSTYDDDVATSDRPLYLSLANDNGYTDVYLTVDEATAIRNWLDYRIERLTGRS